MDMNRKGPRLPRDCDICGTRYEASVRRLARGWDLCCSKRCANTKRVVRCTTWRETARNYTSQNSTSRFKEAMRAKVGYRCQGCQTHQEDLARRLDVHRIIAEADGGEYVESNVRVLCAACHIAEERWTKAG